jgi:hypothetical protein
MEHEQVIIMLWDQTGLFSFSKTVCGRRDEPI